MTMQRFQANWRQRAAALIRYQMRQITPPVVAEAVAGLFFLATAFCLVPILAALFA